MSKHERGILSSYDLRNRSVRFGYVIMVAAILVMVCTMIYPILITFFNGVRPNTEMNTFPPRFFPSAWHFENFGQGWNYIHLLLFLRNTFIIFAGNLIVTVAVLGLAAFSLTHLNVPYRKQIGAFFWITLFIPPTTYIIPNFMNLKELGLLNQFAAFWLPAAANAFYLLLLKNFFGGLHPEIFEAARMDGASDGTCFFRIAFPLSVPIFATLSIFIFSAVWNDWFWPSIVMHSDNGYPLATAIYKYVLQARRMNLNLRFAILFMVMLPPVVVFLLFQKFILRGVQLGGVKG